VSQRSPDRCPERSVLCTADSLHQMPMVAGCCGFGANLGYLAVVKRSQRSADPPALPTLLTSSATASILVFIGGSPTLFCVQSATTSCLIFGTVLAGWHRHKKSGFTFDVAQAPQVTAFRLQRQISQTSQRSSERSDSSRTPRQDGAQHIAWLESRDSLRSHYIVRARPSRDATGEYFRAAVMLEGAGTCRKPGAARPSVPAISSSTIPPSTFTLLF